MSQKLLAWYDVAGRNLPWRHKGGAHPDPYVVLVSEIMLQQTTVKTVIPFFARFMQRFPTVEDLAAAPVEEVYQYWQGLGYYSRARSLHAAAQTIAGEYGSRFPDTKEAVLKLKGIGPYTAASFLALAFNRPETVVDGNVMRIICRMFHYTEPLPDIMKKIREKAAMLTSVERPADYASAIMDLGAEVCTPRRPRCDVCPWRQACLSAGKDDVADIPHRVKTTKKEISGNVYVITDNRGYVFIRRRTEKGLLSGLYEFPWSEKTMFPSAQDTGMSVTHIFTHIRLTLRIYRLQSDNLSATGCFIPPQKLKDYPSSTLMKKVYAAVRPLEILSDFPQNPQQRLLNAGVPDPGK